MEKSTLIERARIYLKTLLEGVHPVTGEPLPQGMVDDKLKNCFTFIDQTLGEYLTLSETAERLQAELDKTKANMQEKQKFFVTPEQCENISLSKEPITLTAFVKNVNSVVDGNSMERFTSTMLKDWLVARGMLRKAKEQTVVSKTVFRPSETAEKLGIIEVESVDKKSGEIKKQLRLDEKAQLFIIENIEEVAKSVGAE
ncbi:MAG: hypothetical protein IJ811_05165 [Clostridia bacterium]|nr:hypothetical protein [Clostridia bacterium]